VDDEDFRAFRAELIATFGAASWHYLRRRIERRGLEAVPAGEEVVTVRHAGSFGCRFVLPLGWRFVHDRESSFRAEAGDGGARLIVMLVDRPLHADISTVPEEVAARFELEHVETVSLGGADVLTGARGDRERFFFPVHGPVAVIYALSGGGPSARELTHLLASLRFHDDASP
jgi:hypothetical protein